MLNTFSLNPCFAGRWVAGHDGKSKSGLDPVLILVLLEDGLLDIIGLPWRKDGLIVLILVLLEDGLLEGKKAWNAQHFQS